MKTVKISDDAHKKIRVEIEEVIKKGSPAPTFGTIVDEMVEKRYRKNADR